MKSSKLQIGYAVSDVDYGSEQDATKVRNLIADDRLVVVKNDKAPEPEELVQFYKLIGRVVAQSEKVVGSGVGGQNELVRVRRNGLFTGAEDGELEWHCAGMNRTGAEDIVAMYMHKMADTGGDTYFSDGQGAFDDLEEETKEVCRSVKSKTVNYPEKMLVGNTHYKNVFADEQTYKSFVDIDGVPAHTKQTSRKELVTKHTVNDKEGLYYPWSVIRGFQGLDRRASHDLYYKLKEHTMSEPYVYRHKWDAHDICLSDQQHSLHRRDAYEGDRELWRAGIWVS